MTRSVRCPCCEVVVLPAYRSLCSVCFPRIPDGLRTDFLRAHYMRVRKPEQYREQLARLLTWRAESGGGRRGEG